MRLTSTIDAPPSPAPLPGLCRLLRLEDVAKHLDVSPSALYRLARAGKIPAKKLGGSWRVSEADLRALCGPLAGAITG